MPNTTIELKIEQSKLDELKDIAIRLNTAAARLENAAAFMYTEAPGWIPIDERLPSKNHVVWGFYLYRFGNKTVGEVFLAEDGDWYIYSSNDVRVSVSHWMEIKFPEPPEAKP